MNIYIIAQYLNLYEQGEDRFFKLGRELNSRGHDVTVFTTSSAVDLDLGKKKIGLVQKNGLKTIAFNVSWHLQMGGLKKMFAYLQFARMTSRQGQRHPRPDLIITASPPLTTALPALKLSEFYQAPVVIEIRELWPDGPVQRGTLRNRLLIKAFRRLEHKAYEKANRIISCSIGVAEALKGRLVEQEKVHVIEEETDGRLLSEKYEHVFKGLVFKGLSEKNKLNDSSLPHREEGK